MLTRLLVLPCIFLAFAPLTRSQESTPDIDAEMQKAMAAPPKSAAEMKAMEAKAEADMKKMTADNDKEEAAEKAKQKAAMQAALEAKGPAALPVWTPQVPQFTPAGPATRQAIDGQPRTVVSGTSPLSPDALADAWDSFKTDHPKFSHERTGSEINHRVDLFVSYRNGEDGTEVKMEVQRKPGEKSTRVTLSSPLPMPPVPSE